MNASRRRFVLTASGLLAAASMPRIVRATGIIFPNRWTTQPPIGARINLGHPLANGLIFYAVFNAGGGDAKTLLPENFAATLLSGATPNWVAGADGSSINWNGTPSAWYERGSWAEPAYLTALYRGRRTGTLPTYARAFGKTANNGGSLPYISYGLEFNSAGAGQDQVIADLAVSASSLRQTGAYTMSPGSAQVHTAGLSWDPSGNLRLWINGLNATTSSFAAAPAYYDATATGRMIISGSSAVTPANQWNGDIYYLAVWNRVLNGAEHEWLHAEPYAMLLPQSPRLSYFIPAPASSGCSQRIALMGIGCK